MLLFFARPAPAADGTLGLGELGFQVSSERREDASGAATSERNFRVDLAAGAEMSVGSVDRFGYGVVMKTERGLHASSEVAGYGAGAFLMWRRNAFSARFDYLLFAEQKTTSAVTETSFRDGTGWALEFRWLPTWFDREENKTWALGPSLSFHRTAFKKVRVGTLPEVATDRAVESISPGLRALFLF